MLPLVKSFQEEGKKIVLPKISSKTMKKVIEFCKHLKENPPGPVIEKPLKSAKMQEMVGKWYAGFVDVGNEELFDIINAADFLGIKPLLDLGCAKVASMMRGKKPQEVVSMFHIEKDFTPEEESRIKKEYKWTEEFF